MHNLGFLICLRFHLGEQPILCGDVKVYEGSAIFVIGEDNNHYSTNGKIISLDQSVMGMVLCGGQKGVSNRSRIIFRTRCQEAEVARAATAQNDAEAAAREKDQRPWCRRKTLASYL